MPLSLRTLALLAPLSLLLLAGCGDGKAATASGGPPPPPAVGVESVEQRDLVDSIELTGRTAAVESVEIRPRVSGHLEAPQFEAGALVEKGQVLFQIDRQWYQADLDRRAAELQAAEARLAIATSENERAAKLVESRAISTEEAQARGSKLNEAKAALAAARAAQASAALDLENTTIRSPIRGRISRALVTEGNFASGIPAANTLLATIVSVDPLYVYADLDEANYLRFAELRRTRANGAEALVLEVGLSGEEGYSRKARLESVDNRIDPGTGTMLLRGLLENPGEALVPGLFVRVRVPLGAGAPALLVDERAVGTDQNQKFVLTLGADDKAEYRKVVLGARLGTQRVIREGLKPKERVIVTGMQRVRPGMQVTPGPVNAEGH